MTMTEFDSKDNLNDGHRSEGDANYSEEFDSDGSSNKELNRKHTSGKYTKTTNSRQSWRHNVMLSSRFRTNSMAAFARDEVSQRVLSAKRLKMNELRNELQSIQMKMKDLEDENRTLKRVQKLQERDLMRYDERKGELPDVYRSHSHEVLSLQNQLRQAKSKNIDLEKNLNSRDRQLIQLQGELKKLQQMVEEQGLHEKKDLTLKIASLEDTLKQKQGIIQELNQQKELTSKAHKRELGVKMSRQRELQKALAELQIQSEKQASLIKEKEKELLKLAMQGSHRRALPRAPLPEPESVTPTSNGTPTQETSRRSEASDISLQVTPQPTRRLAPSNGPTETENYSGSGKKQVDIDILSGHQDTTWIQRDDSERRRPNPSPSTRRSEATTTDAQIKKKDDVLDKLQAIEDSYDDWSHQPNSPSKRPVDTSSDQLQNDKKKDLLAKLQAIDGKIGGEGSSVANGRLANFKTNSKDDDFSFGSYQPSFSKPSPKSSRTSSASAEVVLSGKKSNLMSALFGTSSLVETQDSISAQPVFGSLGLFRGPN